MHANIKKIINFDNLFNQSEETLKRQEQIWLSPTKEELEFEKNKELIIKSYISKISKNDLMTKTFETYICDFRNRGILEKLKRWNPSSNFGVLLFGEPGLGKSHVLKALIGKWARDNIKAVFVSLPNLLDDLKANLDSIEACLSQYKNVDILAIDDIGAEKSSEWTQDQFTQILDYRITRNKITFGSTNLNEQELLQKYHSRLVDRIREQMVFVKMEGDTFRKKIQNNNYKKWDKL